MNAGSPPFRAEVDEQGLPRIAEHLRPVMDEGLRMEIEDYWQRVLAGEPARSARRLPCFWLDLDSRRCRHYPFRPKVCREYICRQQDVS